MGKIMISWITDNVAIGEYLDLDKPNIVGQLKKLGVTAVLNLKKTVKREVSDRLILSDIKYVWCPVKGDEFDISYKLMLYNAYQHLLNIFNSGTNEKVLVCCTAGMDRSPFVVAMYLVLKSVCINMTEAYRLIKKKRFLINIHLDWVWWKE